MSIQQTLVDSRATVPLGPVSVPGLHSVHLPARTLFAVDGPVSADVAYDARDTQGRFEAVVEVPVHAYLSNCSGRSIVDNYLARILVTNGVAHAIQHRLVDVSDDGTTAFVAVSIDMEQMHQFSPERFAA